MKLTVLGNYGPYAKPGGYATSGYLVEEGDTRLVLDLGAGTLTNLLEIAPPETLSGIFVSHLHYDHISDLFALRYALEQKNLSLNLFLAEEDCDLYRLLTGHRLFNVINIDEDTRLELYDFSLTFLKTRHTVTNYAVKISGAKTLVYSGDTVYFEGLDDFVAGADAFLADCTQKPGSKAPHMTVDDALHFADSGIRVLATHLPVDFDPEPYFDGTGNIETVKYKGVYNI